MTPVAAVRAIPYYDLRAQDADVRAEIDAAIATVLDGGGFILGPAVAAFEKEWAQECGAAHAVALKSGTAAIHLALAALGVGPGDEVITQANTYFATLEAIAQTGARSVLVDVTPPTYTMDVTAVAQAITPRTKAIVPVHLFGQPCDLDAVERAAGTIPVIQDASQSHLAAWRGERIGRRGIAAFSFYPGKNLGAYGDAGAVVCAEGAVADRVRMLRHHGMRKKHVHAVLGFNERLDGIQAAVLSAKLPRLRGWTEARRRVAAAYDRLLGDVAKPHVPAEAYHVYHVYPVLVDDRDGMRARLQAHGVETNVHYPIPPHLQEACAQLGYRAGDFPFAEELARRELSLPMSPTMTQEDVAYVAGAFRSSLG